MHIAVLSDTISDARVAATPETIKKYESMGGRVSVQDGAGGGAGISDGDFAAAGARMVRDAKTVVDGADIVLSVNRPSLDAIRACKPGAIVIASMDPHRRDGALDIMASSGVSAFAMEFMPRIARAQAMDVLSSQASLAGYRAIIDASAELTRSFPMMTTAAGTVPPAQVFVMGAGVAGLQAIATARRLGAMVTATDVRPAAKEQVQSLGAKFIAVENEEFRASETAGGYAKPMSKEYQLMQKELIAAHIQRQDVVITTALIPGRAAPVLVTAAMIDTMRSGSVLVDLAVERGGNIEGSKLGEIFVTAGGVRIIGNSTVSRVAATASNLYARNLFCFVETMVDQSTSLLSVNWDDDLVRSTNLTRDGAIVHPGLLGSALN